MITSELTIINKLGLHARAAAKFVNTSSAYASKILVGKEGELVDGKSIMSIMMLAASQGTVLNFQIDGEDEEEAFSALKDIIERRFDEEE